MTNCCSVPPRSADVSGGARTSSNGVKPLRFRDAVPAGLSLSRLLLSGDSLGSRDEALLASTASRRAWRLKSRRPRGETWSRNRFYVEGGRIEEKRFLHTGFSNALGSFRSGS